MKILITGSQGQIGWELLRTFPTDHDVIGLSRLQLDLTDQAAIRRVLRDLEPDVIINAAGYTQVDRAESEPELAAAINVNAVGIVGEEACRLGAAVIHFSTDYVFDGAKSTPYSPSDSPNPLCVYGQTKLEGERALLQSGAAAVVLRTSWVYSLRRKNFLLSVLRRALKKPELRIVNDQTGSPTWCRSVARAAAQIVTQCVVGQPRKWSFGGREGVFHFSGGGSATWFEFARHAIELLPIDPRPALTPISSADFGAAAKRPRYSVLDCQSTANAFNVPIADWRSDVGELLGDKAAWTAITDSSRHEGRHEPVQPTAHTPEQG